MMNKSKLTYRKAILKDIKVLTDYRIIFINEMQGAHPKETEDKVRTALSVYFKKALKDKSFLAWIAENEGKPVGFGGMVIRVQPGHFHLLTGKTGYILNMYTIPEFRKRGICTEILSRLVENGKKLKLSKIELHASKIGEPVYRKFGFKEPAEAALEFNLRYVD